MGFAGSSSGASIVIDHKVRTTTTKSATRNSPRTRCGQVWILSSTGKFFARASAITLSFYPYHFRFAFEFAILVCPENLL